MNLPPPDGVEKNVEPVEAVAPPVISLPPATKNQPQAKPKLEEDDPADSLRTLLLDALVYPWRDSGWMLIVPGAFLLLLMTLAGFGFLTLIATFLIGGYLAAHYFNVIETTLSGKRAQPDWPELGGGVWEALVVPAVRVLAVHVISAAPMLILASLVNWGEAGGAAQALMEWTALAFDCLYFPLAIVAVTLTGNLVSALPHHILPALLRGGVPYLAGAALLLASMTVVQIIVQVLAEVSWVGWFLAYCGIMWAILFQGRFCGLLYRRCQERIGWY